MIDFWASHDINSDAWEASYFKLQQSLDDFTEGINSVANITGEDSRLKETSEDIKDNNSSTISAVIMPAISAATTAPIVTEQICGVNTSLSSTEYSQSVFLSTTSATEVAMITDSDFEFPKVEERDKHFDIVTRVKSTPEPEAMYLCSPLTPRCRAAKTYQKLQEPGCQNRSRHFFKFSKKFPRGQNSRLLGSTFQQYWSPFRLPQPPPLSAAIAAQQFQKWNNTSFQNTPRVEISECQKIHDNGEGTDSYHVQFNV